MKISYFLLLTLLYITSCYARKDSVVYLIRHGEKPDPDITGLSEPGKLRAQCIVNIFGKDGKFKVDKIIA
jgi:hypothetical protein